HKPRLRGGQEHDPARLSQFQGRAGIRIHKSFLHRRLMRPVRRDHCSQARVQRGKACREALAFARLHRAASYISKPVALTVDDPPAGAAKPRIEPEDADRPSDAANRPAHTVSPGESPLKPKEI